METPLFSKNIRYWSLLLGWMMVAVTSASCPLDPKCDFRPLGRTRGLTVSCSGGLHGKFLNGTRRRVHVLTLCRWPDSTFDPTVIEIHFPELRNLAVVESSVTRVLPFHGNMKRLEGLNMSSLRLEWIEDVTFWQLRKLKILDLRFNRLNQLQEAVLLRPSSLQDVYLSENPWDCNSDLTWLVEEENRTSVAHKVVDRDKMICNNESYPRKPVLPVMGMVKTLQDECPKDPPNNCTCRMDYIAPDPDGVTLTPVTTVNCSYRGLQELPEKLPPVTTTLLLKGNQISSLKPLVNNPYYRNVMDVILDDNRIHSIASIEGADWLFTFRVLSLRHNYLKQMPTYALDNALQKNRNALVVYLGNNPWICDCLFTPSFQDFIVKYKTLVKDIADVRCSSAEGDENSLKQIQSLSRSAVCREPSEYLIRPLDLLNGILASLIVLVIGKLIYDYWSFKKTGKLPWIVAKMP